MLSKCDFIASTMATMFKMECGPGEVGVDVREAVILRQGKQDACGAAAVTCAAESAVADASTGRALPRLKRCQTYTILYIGSLKYRQEREMWGSESLGKRQKAFSFYFKSRAVMGE